MSAEILNLLRQQMGVLQVAAGQAAAEYISTGCLAWDAWLLCRNWQQEDLQEGNLQQGGFQRGQLVEWLAASPGCGAGTLALAVAGQAATEGRAVVVIDRARWFYPPAASALGLDLSRLILLRPQTAADEVWALDQTLRCPAVAAVWACLDRVEGRDFRRLQLAAEQSGTIGMLLRPARVQGQPSWSDLQLLVTPHALSRDARGAQRQTRRCWKITMLRCRQGVAGSFILLEMNDSTGSLQVVKARTGELRHETHSLHLAAQLARPASTRRSARA